jgi:hypothetical protein
LTSPDRLMIGPLVTISEYKYRDTCLVSVPVRVDHGDRLEMWHIFLIDVRGKVVGLESLDGSFIDITHWHKNEKQ